MSSDFIYKQPGSSPIRPLQQHMALTLFCIRELDPLFEAAAQDDLPTVQHCHKRISDLKQQADELKHPLRLQLPKGRFLPVSRRDLLGLLDMQDQLAGRIRHISTLICERHMAIPDLLAPPLLELVKACTKVADRASEIVDSLDALIDKGMSGPELRLAKKLIQALHDLEGEIIDRQGAARATLIGCEQTLPALDALFFHQIIQWLAELSDTTQRIGSHLQLILSK